MFVPFREMPSGLASQRPTSPGTCRAPRCPAPSVLSTPRWGVRDSRGKRKPRINRSAQTTISSASSMPSHYPAPSRPKPAWPLAPKGPRLATPGRVAQWESARFTRERTVVRNHPRPLSEAPASVGVSASWGGSGGYVLEGIFGPVVSIVVSNVRADRRSRPPNPQRSRSSAKRISDCGIYPWPRAFRLRVWRMSRAIACEGGRNPDARAGVVHVAFGFNSAASSSLPWPPRSPRRRRGSRVLRARGRR